MSTTTSVMRAAIAYVDGGSPSTVGTRHDALVRAVTRYLARTDDGRTNPDAAGPSGELPATETRAFSQPRGVRRLEKSESN